MHISKKRNQCVLAWVNQLSAYSQSEAGIQISGFGWVDRGVSGENAEMYSSIFAGADLSVMMVLPSFDGWSSAAQDQCDSHRNAAPNPDQ
jgi:hypothetical protein